MSSNLDKYNLAKNECVKISTLIKKAKENQEYWLLPDLNRKSEDAFNYRQDCYKNLSMLEIASMKEV